MYLFRQLPAHALVLLSFLAVVVLLLVLLLLLIVVVIGLETLVLRVPKVSKAHRVFKVL